MGIIKIGRDFFKGMTYNVDVKVEPQQLASNEYRCEDCGNVYEKGWTDEEASQESQAAFGITTGAVVCDDCYNKIMYNRATKIKAAQIPLQEIPPSPNVV